MYFVFLCFYKNEINITNNNNKKKLVKENHNNNANDKLRVLDDSQRCSKIRFDRLFDSGNERRQKLKKF